MMTNSIQNWKLQHSPVHSMIQTYNVSNVVRLPCNSNGRWVMLQRWTVAHNCDTQWYNSDTQEWHTWYTCGKGSKKPDALNAKWMLCVCLVLYHNLYAMEMQWEYCSCTSNLSAPPSLQADAAKHLQNCCTLLTCPLVTEAEINSSSSTAMWLALANHRAQC